MFFVQPWRKSLIDSLLILVEPLKLLLGEHIDKDGFCENGAKGKLFKGIVGTKGDTVGVEDHEHCVFMAYTVTALDVDAGLVSDGHAGQQWGGAPLHAELVQVNGFMDRHELPHTVSCAMQIIDAAFPHGFAGEGVELGAAGALGKDSRTEAYPASEHEGVVTAHLPCEGTERDGACDVGGAVKVLAARVDEQESFGFHGDVRFRGGVIVYNGTMSCCCYN